MDPALNGDSLQKSLPYLTFPSPISLKAVDTIFARGANIQSKQSQRSCTDSHKEGVHTKYTVYR